MCAAPGDGLPKRQTLEGVVWRDKASPGTMIGSVFNGITFPRGRGCWVRFISPSLSQIYLPLHSVGFGKPSPGVGEERGLTFPLGLQSSNLKKDSYILTHDLYLTGRYVSLSYPVLSPMADIKPKPSRLQGVQPPSATRPRKTESPQGNNSRFLKNRRDHSKFSSHSEKQNWLKGRKDVRGRSFYVTVS